MKKNILHLLLFASVASVLAYYAMAINFGKLRAEIEIERRADFLISQGKIGRDCSLVNYYHINRIFNQMGKDSLNKTGVVALDFPVNCMKKMQLVKMSYYASYNTVSGVYRCEKDDIIQELQLAIHLEPRSVPQRDDCMIGSFPKSWNIPAGEATMFSLP